MLDTGIVVPLGFFLAFSYTILGMTKIISDGRTRRRLIESVATPELARAIVTVSKADLDLYGTLSWGIAIGALGLGLIVVQFLPYRQNDPIMLGIVLLFTAAGLLAYYAGARRLMRHRESGGAV